MYSINEVEESVVSQVCERVRANLVWDEDLECFRDEEGGLAISMDDEAYQALVSAREKGVGPVWIFLDAVIEAMEWDDDSEQYYLNPESYLMTAHEDDIQELEKVAAWRR